MAIEATRAMPPSGVLLHDSPKISGASSTGTSTWTANMIGATWVAPRRCRALISLSSASPSDAAAVASQASATRIAPVASPSVSSLLAIAVQAYPNPALSTGNNPAAETRPRNA